VPQPKKSQTKSSTSTRSRAATTRSSAPTQTEAPAQGIGAVELAGETRRTSGSSASNRQFSDWPTVATQARQPSKEERKVRDDAQGVFESIRDLRQRSAKVGDDELTNVLKAAERQFLVAPFTPVV
jgi:hypothetical protein